jgi:hypothetical protein
VGRGGEACHGGSGEANGKEGVADCIAKMEFGMVSAREKVITIWVNRRIA